MFMIFSPMKNLFINGILCENKCKCFPKNYSQPTENDLDEKQM